MDIFTIVIGMIVLLFGQRLFWLFVGFAGFILSFHYAQQILGIQPNLGVFLLLLVIGIIGALLAIFLQKLAIVIAGFIVGGYLSMYFVRLLGVNTVQGALLVTIVGGIISAILLWVIFDYALIGLSSFLGASTIITSHLLSPQTSLLLFLFLFVVGVIFQVKHLKEEE